jgi:hypothetical protein
MPPQKEIIIYTQARYSPFTALARDLLTRYQIPYREIDITGQPTLADHLRPYVRDLDLPTLMVAEPGADSPITPPYPLETSQSPSGLDRGSLISQPNNQQLENWLHKHGFLSKPYKR